MTVTFTTQAGHWTQEDWCVSHSLHRQVTGHRKTGDCHIHNIDRSLDTGGLVTVTFTT